MTPSYARSATRPKWSLAHTPPTGESNSRRQSATGSVGFRVQVAEHHRVPFVAAGEEPRNDHRLQLAFPFVVQLEVGEVVDDQYRAHRIGGVDDDGQRGAREVAGAVRDGRQVELVYLAVRPSARE